MTLETENRLTAQFPARDRAGRPHCVLEWTTFTRTQNEDEVWSSWKRGARQFTCGGQNCVFINEETVELHGERLTFLRWPIV